VEWEGPQCLWVLHWVLGHQHPLGWAEMPEGTSRNAWVFVCVRP